MSPHYGKMGKVARRRVCATCVTSGVVLCHLYGGDPAPPAACLVSINKHPTFKYKIKGIFLKLFHSSACSVLIFNNNGLNLRSVRMYDTYFK